MLLSVATSGESTGKCYYTQELSASVSLVCLYKYSGVPHCKLTVNKHAVYFKVLYFVYLFLTI